MVGGQMVFRDGRGDRSNTTEPYQVNFIVTTKSSDPPPLPPPSSAQELTIKT